MRGREGEKEESPTFLFKFTPLITFVHRTTTSTVVTRAVHVNHTIVNTTLTYLLTGPLDQRRAVVPSKSCSHERSSRCQILEHICISY